MNRSAGHLVRMVDLYSIAKLIRAKPKRPADNIRASPSTRIANRGIGRTRACSRSTIALHPRRSGTAVVHQDWGGPRKHIVRVRAEALSSAFSQVSEIRPVRGGAWKYGTVRPCCRRRCRQTATRVRSVEWALAGVLFGLGSGMVRGPYAGWQLGQALGLTAM